MLIVESDDAIYFGVVGLTGITAYAIVCLLDRWLSK